MQKLKIKLDIDDVLVPYVSVLIEELKKRGIHLKQSDFTRWDFTNFPPETKAVILEVMSTYAVLKHQAPLDGAQEFVLQLQERGHQVLIATAVRDDFATFRHAQAREFFPTIAEDDIHIIADKSSLVCDISWDDGAHHVEDSKDRFPVLRRQPWNHHLTDCLTADSFEGFLRIVDLVASGKNPNVNILGLVGPSASGKTLLADELAKSSMYGIIRSSTTRDRRPDDAEDAYYFISREEFEAKLKAGNFIEHTEYLGNFYGLTHTAVNEIIEQGRIAVTPVDIVGVRALTESFGDRVVSIYVDRDRKVLSNAILARNISDELKRTRIRAMDEEVKNKDICDYVVHNVGDISYAAEQVHSIMNTDIVVKKICA